MNYSQSTFMCRVDFFKPSGKWYTTEAVDMMDAYVEDSIIQDKVLDCIIPHLNGRLKGMWAVVLDPYHPRPFPLMLKIPE